MSEEVKKKSLVLTRDKKKFEKQARTLLKYGIGNTIEEAREKLQLMLDVNEIVERNKTEKVKNNEENPDV